jgi:hypothetical protein
MIHMRIGTPNRFCRTNEIRSFSVGFPEGEISEREATMIEGMRREEEENLGRYVGPSKKKRFHKEPQPSRTKK